MITTNNLIYNINMSQEAPKFSDEQLRRFKYGIFRQFKQVKFSGTDKYREEEKQLPFILKMRRIQYTMEKMRMLEENKELTGVHDFANLELVNDLRFQTKKYTVLSTVLGLNGGFWSYHIMKTRLYWYVALPLSFGVAFVSRNLVMRNTMDRIYYPIESVYKHIRKLELKKIELDQKMSESIGEKLKNEKPKDKHKVEVSKEDLAKGEILRKRNQNLIVEEYAKREFE